ncbi:MAG: hypothetical protein ACRDQV_09140 [Pseudonocardiaceae bacterium]
MTPIDDAAEWLLGINYDRAIARHAFISRLIPAQSTVVVTVVRDKVWLSISPPFTWEAIMDPAKVDELMHVLELATDEARQVGAARNGGASQGDRSVVQAITSGPEA